MTKPWLCALLIVFGIMVRNPGFFIQEAQLLHLPHPSCMNSPHTFVSEADSTFMVGSKYATIVRIRFIDPI